MIWDKDKNYTRRSASEFNFWRGLFQYIICAIFYRIRASLIYRLKHTQG